MTDTTETKTAGKAKDLRIPPKEWKELLAWSDGEIQRQMLKELQSISANLRLIAVAVVVWIILYVISVFTSALP